MTLGIYRCCAFIAGPRQTGSKTNTEEEKEQRDTSKSLWGPIV